MSGPYQVKLDPEHARELASRGATLVLLDVPEGTAVGVDHHVRLIILALLISSSLSTDHTHLYYIYAPYIPDLTNKFNHHFYLYTDVSCWSTI